VTTGAKDKFTTVMKERGVVKGFRENRTNKVRFWQGIGVTSESAVTQESPAKDRGVVEKVTPKPDFEKHVYESPIVRGVYEKDDSAVTLSPEVSREYEFDGLGED
jgi:hypothetical protein